jgi:pimeloyl-ACP methyl ester carboxylesterase
MMTPARALALYSTLTVAIAAPGFPAAQTQSANAARSSYTRPLGIALETWDYPYPVHFLDLDLESRRERMAYMDVAPEGNANGRTVMLLHGKNFFGAYWAGTIRELSRAGYRVVVPDQIGFGKSSKPDLAYSFDLLAANTVRLLDSLGVRETAVVGHSMGGMLAVRFARNYPDRTARLVLENPIGLEDYRLKVPPQPTEKLIENELGQTEEKVRAYIKSYPVRWVPEVFEPFVEVQSRVILSGEYPRWARAAALTYQMLYQQPVRHEFSLIRAPTLLVIGQADRTAPGKNYVSEEVRRTLGQYPELGRAAARDIPGARLVELPNVGHIPHLEMPEQFHRELLEFLGSASSAR